MHFKFIILFIFLNSEIISQTQQIRGTVRDHNSNSPLPFCRILISGSEGYETKTDASGKFRAELPPGKYNLTAFKEGFKMENYSYLELTSGKQYILDVELFPLQASLDTVSVHSGRASGEINIDVWESQKFPAVFNDPARIINSSAGAINTDDQSNNISVYGTSPNYIQWKMEGVEVVNPNHLENSGTFNDRSTLNGGGVSMLSAQVLQNSTFQYAPFPAQSGNALSGVFDIKFRKGNDEKSERIIQAGLLGTDLSIEGPFTKKAKASYLFNYRYSTIGLLSLMGVDFGKEKINFQDLSFHISIPVKNGCLRSFGVIGASANRFKGTVDSNKIETQKDLQDINYSSVTGIAGISYIVSLNNTTYIKSVIAWSQKKVSREAIPLTTFYDGNSTDHLDQEKLSSVVYISKRMKKAVSIKGGSFFNYYHNLIKYSNNIIGLKGELDDPLIQPFISVDGIETAKIEWKFGLQGFIQPRIAYYDLQPRTEIIYSISDDQHLSFSYGKTSQLHPTIVYLMSYQNKNLKPCTSHAFNIVHAIKVRRVHIHNKFFFHQLLQVPVNDSLGYSLFNYFNEVLTFSLVSNGQGRIYGYDLSLERSYKGFYLMASGTLYNSEYSLNKKNYRASRFNTGYNTVICLGKEFDLNHSERFLSINLKGNLRGGFREEKITNGQFNYSSSLPEYARLDLRIAYKRNRKNMNSLWSLDIQNITNRKNIAYYYYDQFLGSTETRYQLGLIPVLSYKVFF